MIKKLFGMFLCFFLIFSITGCQLINRIPIEIDATQFTKAMENYDFKVYDNTKTLNSDFVTKNLIAIKNKKQIEFYQFKNEDDCKKSYESTRNKIANNQQLVSETQNKNCIKTVVTTEAKYYTVVKIGKVMVYCTSNIDVKDDIDAIVANFNF